MPVALPAFGENQKPLKRSRARPRGKISVPKCAVGLSCASIYVLNCPPKMKLPEMQHFERMEAWENVKALARKLGINRTLLYVWKRKAAGFARPAHPGTGGQGGAVGRRAGAAGARK